MKLVDVLMLSLAVVFLVISAYETIVSGIVAAYWSLMILAGLFFFFVYRKKR